MSERRIYTPTKNATRLSVAYRCPKNPETLHGENIEVVVGASCTKEGQAAMTIHTGALKKAVIDIVEHWDHTTLVHTQDTSLLHALEDIDSRYTQLDFAITPANLHAFILKEVQSILEVSYGNEGLQDLSIDLHTGTTHPQTGVHFRAAHRLVNDESPCHNLHGHDYFVDIQGIQEGQNIPLSSELQEYIQQLVQPWQNSALVWEQDTELKNALAQADIDYLLLSGETTMENMLGNILDRVSDQTKQILQNKGITALEAHLKETATSSLKIREVF